MNIRTHRGNRPRRPTRVAAAWLTAGALLLTGCEFHGLYDLPLPGGAAADHNYHVTVDFQDVMDLVPQSAVKVDDVTVGSVEKVELDGWRARVRLRVSDTVHLPANAVAELRQTSMLGEKYIALSAPTDTPPEGRLADGARIPLSRSDRDPDVEEVLAALSALLNGGGVAQLHTITVELDNALRGRESHVRSLLSELNTFVGGLDRQRSQIIRAMNGIDKLSRTLNQQNTTIGQAVDAMPPALRILADQRRHLTTMLTALSRLGTTGTRVINASRDDTVADLRQLQPILTELNAAGSDLPNSLELLTTFPFPRDAVDTIKGDYTNLHLTADLNLAALYDTARRAAPTPAPGPSVPGLPGLPTPTLPTLPPLPKLPIPAPTLPCLPGTGCAPGPSASPTGGSGGGALCPPLCTGTGITYRSDTSGTGTYGGIDSGIDMALAELMTEGMQP